MRPEARSETRTEGRATAGAERRLSRGIVDQRESEPPGEYVPRELPADRLTPVFGTAEPTSGLPAAIRARAYRLSSANSARWLLLMFADRVETGGNLAKELVTPGRQPLVIRHVFRQARAEPLGTAWLAAAIALSVWLIRRKMRGSRPRRLGAKQVTRMLSRIRG